ncbi:MAG: lysoplasmalogenase [Alphaproteobacteria bacterium]|nr:lysoplasmalogenase [Alphaproteobacteria bacterium]
MLEAIFLRQDGLDALRVTIAAASVLAAIVYLRFVDTAPSTMRTALKTFMIAILAPLPLTYLGAGSTWLLAGLTLALALSALGDFFLALERQERYFVLGLASFLAGHIAYVGVMLPNAIVPRGVALALVLVAVGAASAFIAWLLPSLGRMKVPVLAYFAVIMAMVASALSIPGAPWTLGAGAVLFALSDSLIAVRKFKQPFPFSNVAVWVTYAAAQFLIVGSLLVIVAPAGYPF